jgi:hypothetical protein
VTGELRIAGGLNSRTRFGTPVELATGSRKQYLLYALPPTFGGNMTVELVSGDQVLAKSLVAVALHDQTQLVVGIVSEAPARLVGQLDLLPNQNGVAPVVAPLAVADLPERVQAWAPIDRLVWQDVDAASLTPGQLAALRTWISGGGRLVIIGGTAAADALTASPTTSCRTARPGCWTSTRRSCARSSAASRRGDAAHRLRRGPRHGRALATSGDRVIAADSPYGSGSVTLVGFDPTTAWIAEGDTLDVPLWRRLLPPAARHRVAQRRLDDRGRRHQPAQPGAAADRRPARAAARLHRAGRPGQLPAAALARPAGVGVGHGAGPDRAVHRRRVRHRVPDPRLGRDPQRGGDRARARHGPGARPVLPRDLQPHPRDYQVRVAGDALLAAPMNGDMFNGDPNANIFGGGNADLDVLQGDPSRVRDLNVGFGSLRMLRAEASATGPEVTADLRLEGGRIKGTVTNHSSRTLVAQAVVLGSSADTLRTSRRAPAPRWTCRSRSRSPAPTCLTRSSARSTGAASR